MKIHPSQDKTIVCVHSLRDYAGREHFAGILDFCRNHPSWNIKFIDPNDLDEPAASRALAHGFDGIIIAIPGTPKAMRALLQAPVPIVFANVGAHRLADRRKQTSFVWTDNGDIGEKGARFLMSLSGFAVYAFVGDRECNFWSTERARAFRDCIVKAGNPCRILNHPESLGSWLVALPKPAAIMASHDLRAAEVISACKRLDISVPDQVAVLGADNDPALQKSVRPKISSIPIDFRQMGFREAEELNRLMSCTRRKGRPEILIPAGDVIPRQSTHRNAKSAQLILGINTYIAEHAQEKIRIADLVRTLNCSRRLAELRFRQAMGFSIRQAIEAFRMTKALELTKTTDFSANAIANLCGYAGGQRLNCAFKTRFGLSISQWRKANKPVRGR